MTCLKCGRETDQTFCESCREVMARYPVKPGTIVQLPKDRSTAYAHRSQNWRTTISPEIQIEKQKRTIRRLAQALAALAALLVVLGIVMFRVISSAGRPPVGQNYSAVTKSTEDATEPTIVTGTGETAG